MRIKNLDGKSWISQLEKSWLSLHSMTIHIVNAEVESAELKGTQFIIKVRKE